MDSSKVIKETFFDVGNVSSQRQSYASRTDDPFEFCVFDDLIDDELLRGVRKEMFGAIHASHKETDIYRVFQTGDLANLDALSDTEKHQLRHLHALRNGLYSQRFREAVSRITGCGRLSGTKTDISANIYRKGCHLLCHDDAIGTRSISFILYLPDVEPVWEAQEGGALELYPSVKPSTPADHPSVRLLPKWNRMALFAVQPGKSFHSVQEVVSERPRPSIQGWFHFPTAEEEAEHEKNLQEQAQKRQKTGASSPEDASATAAAVAQLAAGKKKKEKHVATLKQLEEAALAESAAFKFRAFTEHAPPSFVKQPTSPASPAPSPAQEQAGGAPLAAPLQPYLYQLQRWVNPKYLTQNTLEAVQTQFAQEASITLHHFLNADVAQALLHAAQAADQAAGLDAPRLPTDDLAGVRPPFASPASSSALAGSAAAAPPGGGNGWVVKGSPIYRRHLGSGGGGGDQVGEGNVEESKRARDEENSASSQGTAAVGGGGGIGNGRAEERALGLLQDVQAFFGCKAFQQLMLQMTPLLPTGARTEIRRFRPGLDYTLATKLALSDSSSSSASSPPPVFAGVAESTDEAVLEATLSIVAEEAKWAGDELGGYIVYMEPDNGNDDAAIYKANDAEDGGALLSVSPSNNALTLVLRGRELLAFTKYVSALAPGSRWDVRAEISLDPASMAGSDGDGDEGDESEEGDEEDDDDDEGRPEIL